MNSYLAKAIYEVENFRYGVECAENIELSVDLNSFKIGNVKAEKSCDGLCWHLWETHDCQVRPFLKIVPTGLDIEQIDAVLNAQPWQCI